MKKGLLLILVLVLGLSLLVTGCGDKKEEAPAPNGEETATGDGSWKRVQDAGKIKAGLDDGFPPMGFRNDKGELVGFDIDMGKEITKRTGLEIEWVPTDWNGIVPSLLAKKFDVIHSGMNMWEERKEAINFAGPYGVASQVILVKKDNNDKIESLEDLKDQVIGTQLGGTGQQESSKAGFDEKNMKLYNKFPEAFADLDNGRTVAVVVDSFAAPEWLKTGKYKKVGQEIGMNKEAVIGIGVRKEDKELRDQLDAVIKEMLEDGTLTKLSNEWLGYDITEQLESDQVK
ncbi:amino acid ABC transporter substrate-binding protein, PAAT family [Desulfonispora thiosulfatigenes DSM 11270]|uniref:Amino acid ABC transporter substrate-binding protein, PAAT family n=1 Tax=Desulfonispora thiosulfatigenes DSM 11270 TaxID=656914 RepID=A0A1W1V032_DESTI|nr:transporter substrate-binding domain-containing protein [Desulfonispora thiosulfatigenes]SMB86715.1 amino acid ABC transporter substrate-binding protein, PAAT family [Desulfonispora thiosulfatigenes DSM 11270]